MVWTCLVMAALASCTPSSKPSDTAAAQATASKAGTGERNQSTAGASVPSDPPPSRTFSAEELGSVVGIWEARYTLQELQTMEQEGRPAEKYVLIFNADQTYDLSVTGGRNIQTSKGTWNADAKTVTIKANTINGRPPKTPRQPVAFNIAASKLVIEDPVGVKLYRR